MYKYKYQFAVLLMMVFLMGCAGAVQKGAAVLEVNKEIYDISLNMAGDLYLAGVIDDAQKDKVIEVGTWYMEGHNIAVSALLEYQRSPSDEAWIKYLNALSDVAERLKQLINLKEELR